jgi:antitoxin ParD1/3/4
MIQTGSDAMPSSYTLGRHFESFIQSQLASGRYNNASEIVREGLRLLEDRERKLAALDRALTKGIDDIESGRMTPAETVFDELERKYRRMERDSAPV